MFIKYCTISFTILSLFIFLSSFQIAQAQCNPGDLDTDNDGICNAEDLDDDNDGILDENELAIYSIYQHNREDISYFASNVPYTVTGATTISGTYDSRTIQGDITYNGVGWDLLATDINPNSAGMITVQIAPTSSTNGAWVIADAILVTDGTNHFIVDDTDTGFSFTGSWLFQSLGGNIGYNGNNHYRSSGSNGGTATWSVSNLNGGGNGVATDTDGDGISNALDLDSDNDGCPDATEGSAGFTLNDIDPSGALTGGVDTNPNSPTYGVPLMAGSGQTIKSSLNSSELPNDISCLCAGLNMPVDTDNDGICDVADTCTNFDDT